MRIVISLALFAIVLGCNTVPRESDTLDQITDDQRKAANGWMVTSPQDRAVRNAVVRESALYPYHFVEGSAEMNELGAQRLAILADHFVENPGNLVLRKSDTANTLYRARRAHVALLLEEQGVDIRRVTMTDGDIGGDGLRSVQLVEILQEQSDGSGALVLGAEAK